MQFQHNLTTLGLARLKLFESFTLPSMESQTNQNFLWVLRTDPKLVKELKLPLMAALRNSPIRHRLVLLADNENPAVFSNGTADSRVILGNSTLLKQYLQYSQRPDSFVMETDLDADDAIPKDFVNFIQSEARSHMRYHRPKDWIMWCNHYQFEWHVVHPSLTKSTGAAESEGRNLQQATEKQKKMLAKRMAKDPRLKTPFGFVARKKKDRCITPGLTLAYDAASTEEDLPDVIWHTKIDILHPACNEDDFGATKCVHRMYEDRPGSFRARTLTSTGMHGVNVPSLLLDAPPAEGVTTTAASSAAANGVTTANGAATAATVGDRSNGGAGAVAAVVGRSAKKTKKTKKRRKKISDGRDKLWTLVEQEYGVSRYDLYDTRNLLLEQTRNIALENLKGQCTKDHSCKTSTQKQLQAVVGGP